MIVYIVSLEWNEPPSDVTGDTGIVSVHASEADANAAAARERAQLESEGTLVYNYTYRDGRYCETCGTDLASATCPCPKPASAAVHCGACGGALDVHGYCMVDKHDAWDVDVHVTAHQVQEATDAAV